MRRTMLVAVLGLVGALAAPAQAAAPHPDSCTFAGAGAVTPAAEAGGFTATGVVVTFEVEVVCSRDPLRTTVLEMTEVYTGHLTVYVTAPDGSTVCAANPVTGGAFESTGPVLTMANTGACVVPYTDPRRNQPLRLQAYWATLPPYISTHRGIAISPVGAGT